MFKLEELETTHERMHGLEDEYEKNRRLAQLTTDKSKKDLNWVKKQLNQERSLKLDAFQRVDELQATVCI